MDNDINTDMYIVGRQSTFIIWTIYRYRIFYRDMDINTDTDIDIDNIGTAGELLRARQ